MDTFYTTSRPQIKSSDINFQRCPGINLQRCPPDHRTNATKPTELLPPQNNSNSDKTTTRQHHQHVPERHLFRHYDIPCLQRCIEIRTVRLVRIRLTDVIISLLLAYYFSFSAPDSNLSNLYCSPIIIVNQFCYTANHFVYTILCRSRCEAACPCYSSLLNYLELLSQRET